MKAYWPVLRLLPLLTTCALLSCNHEESVRQRELLAFGTIVQISLREADPDKASQAFELAQQRLQQLHREWNPWQLPGKLAEVNLALASGKTAQVDSTFMATVNEALQLSSKSGGLFNPMLGHLTRLWGFHSDTADPGLPGEALLSNWLEDVPESSDLIFTDNSIGSGNKVLQFDFGAFAKGYAIDVVVEEMRGLGIKHMIINAGGDLRAIGRHGDRPWSIAIRHPRNNDVLALIETSEDESVFTSGDYERFFIKDQQRYHHIIDPRTARPAVETVAVTVIGDSASVTDAAATALFVAGPDAWLVTAAAMDIKYALLIDRYGNIHTTPAMAERINMNEKYEHKAF